MAAKIVVDAGHNGISDPGAVYNGRRESDDVLQLALAVGDILAQNGYDVEFTRTGDMNQTVTQKAQFANNAGADLFISLHRNAAAYPGQYSGAQTLIYDWNGFKPEMAENINRNLEELGFRNIGVDIRTDLAVLRRTQMPALLVEVGFIDSAKDNQIFDSRFDEIAQGIADGIMETLDGVVAEANRSYATEEETAVETMVQPASQDDPRAMTFQPFYPAKSAPPVSAPEPSDSPAIYRVQVGAFYNLQNAIELEQELKRLGYNTWIVTT